MKILLCERINDANEYVQLLAQAYEEAGNTVVLDVQNFLFSCFVPDVVHIQWPEAIYRWRHQLPPRAETVNFIKSRLDWYKQKGCKILCTAHNLQPHEPVHPEFERRMYETMIGNSDIILHHGHASISLLKTAVPECRKALHLVVPHGPYPVRKVSAVEAREYYGIDPQEWVILNFGRQRKNKGPDFTDRVFKNIGRGDVRLFTIGPRDLSGRGLVGKAVDIAKREAGTWLDKARRRTTVYRRVPHDEIPRIMSATDIVLLGHQQGLNSGIIALAASYSKAVVFPDIGNFSEQLSGWKWCEGYVVGNVDSAVSALESLRNRLGDFCPGDTLPGNENWLEANSWSKQVESVEQVAKGLQST